MVRPAKQLRGAVALEAAIVLPVFLALALGLIQLTLLEHAKLMTQYAAFCAARAGIVWNGNNQSMRDAALLALLPMQGRTDDLVNLTATLARQRLWDQAFRQIPWGSSVPNEINGSPMKGLVRVDTLHPTEASFAAIARDRALPRIPEEVDFDATEDVAVRRAGLLTIRVRYWYELRVPFANWLLFLAWYASNASLRISGELDRPRLASGEVLGTAIPPQASGIAHRDGYPTASSSEMQVLWGLASGRLPLGLGRRVFLPITATYSLRMQSSFYRKWVMHDRSFEDEQ